MSTPPAAAAASTAAPAAPLLQRELPVHLTGSSHGWLGAYRRWPVYSQRWARLRLRPWGLAWALVTGLMLLHQQLSPALGGSRWMGALSLLLGMAFWFGLPMLLGPWLASHVRRRGWPARRETSALLLAFALTAALTLAAEAGLRPLLKRQLSAWIDGPSAPMTMVIIDLRLSQEAFGPDGRPLPVQDEAALEAAAALYKPLLQAIWSALYLALLLLVAGAAGLAGLRRERRELAELQRLQELAAAQEARREAETRLALLQAQIEPHFLFNTLAGVRGAIEADPQRAQALVDHLVDYLRASIPRLRADSSRSDATLGSQWAIVRAYLGLMATRLPRLHGTLQMEPGLEDLPCPPLLLPTLVENALRHGIEPRPGPGHIAVEARRGTGPDGRPALLLEVRDDGVGLAAAAGAATGGAGLGLVNLRERLRALYGTRARLELRSLAPQGTLARLTLPLETPG